MNLPLMLCRAASRSTAPARSCMWRYDDYCPHCILLPLMATVFLTGPAAQQLETGALDGVMRRPNKVLESAAPGSARCVRHPVCLPRSMACTSSASSISACRFGIPDSNRARHLIPESRCAATRCQLRCWVGWGRSTSPGRFAMASSAMAAVPVMCMSVTTWAIRTNAATSF